jgi:iron complex outermembrane recepter protein
MGICILLMLAGSATVHAQSTGNVMGTVLDPAGNAVQNATVAVRNEASSMETRSTTDAQGKFSVTGLAAGTYTVEISSPGFALASRPGVQVPSAPAGELSVSLQIGSVSDAITVEANASNSIAAQNAPMDGLLEARSARTEVTPVFVQNFTSPNADFGELVEMASGTFSINSNGIGLGQDKTYFRGFPDGDYDIDFDGVPFYDTNTPTHHSWAFFPDPWTGSVDFDRSPGTASTIGPTPFGGSIHLLSPDMTNAPIIQGNLSYGSFHTMIFDGNFDSGYFGGKKSNLLIDVQHMQSDGYETDNFQIRNAGSLKYIYKFSENNILTGYSGVVWLDSNTPNANPTRGQIDTYGYNFLLTSDSNASELNASGNCIVAAGCLYPLNYQFYTYHVPTDFEYVDWSKQWGHGWQTDFKPYTLSYYNAQYYESPKYNADGVTFKSGSTISPTSAVDKLNSYRKYGETFEASQVSKYGIFRAGLWYEWATTNRYQIPSDPLDRVDALLPNFHESFYTGSYQPFAEYEFHATQRLTITAGFKFAYFNQNLTQYQDNGKIVGCLGGTLSTTSVTATSVCNGGVPFVNHSAGYDAYLPSVDANYHILSNWSVYGQYATGTIVPPSAVFDVTGANVISAPPPTGAKTFQGGTVLKLKRMTLNADVYRTRFQGTYTALANVVNDTTGFDYTATGDSVTKGFEAEVNVYLARGLSFYANGTVGKADYVSPTIISTSTTISPGLSVANPNYGLWVANTPSNTEAFGLTYAQKHFEVGMFDKRVGPMWNDNTAVAGAVSATDNQVIPINPFSTTNFYFNYMLHNGSHFDQTKFRLSVNNLFNSRGIVGDTQTAAGTTYTPGPGDQLVLLPGRSFTLTISPGYSPKR